MYAPPTAPRATRTETISATPESGWIVTAVSLCQNPMDDFPFRLRQIASRGKLPGRIPRLQAPGEVVKHSFKHSNANLCVASSRTSPQDGGNWVLSSSLFSESRNSFIFRIRRSRGSCRKIHATEQQLLARRSACVVRNRRPEDAPAGYPDGMQFFGAAQCERRASGDGAQVRFPRASR